MSSTRSSVHVRQSKPLVDWVNSLCSSGVSTLKQLSSGQELVEIVGTILSGSAPPDSGIDFVFSSVQIYYGTTDLTKFLDLDAIKRRDDGEIGKLVLLVLIWATQSEKNDYFVSRILEMDAESQNGLMQLIKGGIKQIQDGFLDRGVFSLPEVQGTKSSEADFSDSLEVSPMYLDEHRYVTPVKSVASAVASLEMTDFFGSPALKNWLKTPACTGAYLQSESHVKKLERDVVRLKHEVAMRNEECEEINCKLFEKEDNCEKTKHLCRELQRKASQVDSLKAKIEDLSMYESQAKLQTTEIIKLHQEVERLKMFQEALEESKLEVANLNKELGIEKEKNKDYWMKQIHSMKHEVSTSKLECERLQDQHETMKELVDKKVDEVEYMRRLWEAEKELLNQKIQGKQQEVRGLKMDVERLSVGGDGGRLSLAISDMSRLMRLEEENVLLNKQLDELSDIKDKFEDANAVASTLKKEESSRIREIEELKCSLRSTTIVNEAMSQEVEGLKSRFYEAQQALTDAEQRHNIMIEAAKHNAKLQCAEMADAHEKKSRALCDEMGEVKEALAKEKAALESTAEMAEALEKEKARLEETVESSAAELETIEMKCVALSSEMAEAKEAIGEVKKAADDWKNQYVMMAEANEALETETAALKHSLESTTAELKESEMKSMAQSAEMAKEKEEIEEVKAAAEEWKVQYESMTEAKDALEKEKQVLEEALDSSTAEMGLVRKAVEEEKAAVAEWKAQYDEIAEAREVLEKEKVALKEALDLSAAELKEREMKLMTQSAEMAEKKEEIEEVNAAAEEWQVQYESVAEAKDALEKEKLALEEALGSSTAEMGLVREAVDEEKAAAVEWKAQYDEMAEAREVLEKEKVALKEALNLSAAELKEHEMKLMAQSAEMAEKKEEIEEVNAAAGEWKVQYESMAEAKQALEKEKQALEEALESSTAEMGLVRKAVEEGKAAVAEWKVQYESMAEAKDALEKEKQVLEEALGSSTTEMGLVREAVDEEKAAAVEWKAQYDEMAEVREVLEKEKVALKEALDLSAAELKESEMKWVAQSSEMAEVKEAVENEKASAADWKDQYSKMAEAHGILEREMAALKETLESSTAELQQSEKKSMAYSFEMAETIKALEKERADVEEALKSTEAALKKREKSAMAECAEMAEANEELQKEKAKLEQALEYTVAKLEATESQSGAQCSEIAETNKAVEEAKVAASQWEAQCAKMAETSERLGKEKEALEKALELNISELKTTEENAMAQSLELAQVKEAFEIEKAATSKWKDQYSQMMEANEALEKGKVALEEALESSGAELKASEVKWANLSLEIAETKEASEKAKVAAVEWEAQCGNTMEANKVLEKEKATLQEALECADANLKAYEEKAGVDSSEMTEMKKTVEELKTSVGDWEVQYEKMRGVSEGLEKEKVALNEALVSTAAELKASEKSASEIAEEVSALKSALTAKEREGTQAAESERHLSEMEDVVRSQNTRIASFSLREKTFQETVDDLKKANELYKEQLDCRKDFNEGMEKRIAEVKKDLKENADQLKEEREKNQLLEKELEEYQDLQGATMKTERAEHDRLTAALRAEIRSLEVQLATASQQLRQHNQITSKPMTRKRAAAVSASTLNFLDESSDFEAQTLTSSARGAPPEDDGSDSRDVRLLELQRRNSRALPHLQSSYPIETQTCAQNLSQLTETQQVRRLPKQSSDLTVANPRRSTFTVEELARSGPATSFDVSFDEKRAPKMPKRLQERMAKATSRDPKRKPLTSIGNPSKKK